MVARAVSAGRLLTPLAVLVPIGATLVGTFWALTIFPPLSLVVIATGLALTAYAGRATYGTGTSLVAGVCTLLASPVAFVLWWAVSINTSICGKDVSDGWTALAVAIGALAFLALGTLGVRTYRAATMMPMALLGAVLAMLLVFALAPGAAGVCET